MDNGGFYGDHYNSVSSDDELMDISDVSVDFSEDVPPLDFSAGRDRMSDVDITARMGISCTLVILYACLRASL